MANPLTQIGLDSGRIDARQEKTFLIHYRTRYQHTLKGPLKVAINNRIRELHKQTPA